MWVQPLGQEGPLEEEMAPHSSILAWELPWTEEPVHGVAKELGIIKLLNNQYRNQRDSVKAHGRECHYSANKLTMFSHFSQGKT